VVVNKKVMDLKEYAIAISKIIAIFAGKKE